MVFFKFPIYVKNLKFLKNPKYIEIIKMILANQEKIYSWEV